MTETPATPKITPALWTTRRAIATWSFCIGLWSTIVFWWYPYSIFVATTGLVLGLVSLVMGWKAGKDGENLALGGVALCANTIFMAAVVYRVMQVYFGDLTTPVFP